MPSATPAGAPPRFSLAAWLWPLDGRRTPFERLAHRLLPGDQCTTVAAVHLGQEVHYLPGRRERLVPHRPENVLA